MTQWGEGGPKNSLNAENRRLLIGEMNTVNDATKVLMHLLTALLIY
jgi:hypothetical protein